MQGGPSVLSSCITVSQTRCCFSFHASQDSQSRGSPAANLSDPKSSAAVSRHCLIHVHRRLMTIDNEMLLVASANMDQRSMDGTRDTEMSIVGYQVGHLMTYHEGHQVTEQQGDMVTTHEGPGGRAGVQLPVGQASRYRRVLWKERIKV